jgi:hypothetical protein
MFGVLIHKEFIILKDMAQRHQPHIQYGKVNDQWVKLKHEGYYEALWNRKLRLL